MTSTTPVTGGFGSPVADVVHDLLAPVVTSLGAELVDVQWTGGTLRLAIDCEGGITTDRLAEINRLVSPILDQHDPIPGRYTLEVSSPGVERPLRRPEHFERAVGEVVVVKAVPGHRPRRLRGRLTAFDGERLSIEADEVDGVERSETEARTVALADVATARTHFEWGPAPKPGRASKGRSSGKAQRREQAQQKRQEKSQ